MKLILGLMVTLVAFGQGWTELTNTAVVKNSTTNSVCPPQSLMSPSAPSYPCQGVIIDWGGAAADTTNNRLLIPAQGGHSSWVGNEVYSLDLASLSSTTATSCTLNVNGCSTNASAPAMTRLNNPSPWRDCASFPNQADGSTFTGHGEGSSVFFAVADSITNAWLGGCYSSGGPVTQLQLFNLTTHLWGGNTNYIWTGNPSDLPFGTESHITLDPTTPNESFVGWVGGVGVSPQIMVRYDTVTNIMSELIPYAYSGAPVDLSVIVDPDRHLLFSIGNNGTASAGKMLVTDITGTPPLTPVDITSSVSGCSDLINASFPGLQWDTVHKKITGFIQRRQVLSTSSVTAPSLGSLPTTLTFAVPAGQTIPINANVGIEALTGGAGSSLAGIAITGTVQSYSGTSLVILVSSTSPITGYVPVVQGSGSSSSWLINIQYNEIIVYDHTTHSCTINPLSQSGGPMPDYSNLDLDRSPSGRWSYFPKLNKYVAVLDYATDAWTVQLDNTPSNGLGGSSLTCLDRDGDGYGTGPTRLGPFTDLVIDGANPNKVTSASHTFTTADVETVLAINGGSGFTVQQNNTIASVSGGAAILTNPAGTVGSTGGLWMINGCLGPDADDLDSGVHTSSQYITKWASIPIGLNHQGYNPLNIWYVSTTGVDTGSPAACQNNSASPCATATYVYSHGYSAGDAVMFRGGLYTESVSPPTGTAGSPSLILAYPGELPEWKDTGGFSISGLNYLVMDGLRFNNTHAGGNGAINAGNTSNIAFRHVDVSQALWGIVAANTAGFVLSDFTIEDSTAHDNCAGGGQHGFYISNHDPANSINDTILLRRNLLFYNCYNGIQMNGRFTNAVIEQNEAYGNFVGGFAWLNGVSKSKLRNNLSFDNRQTGLAIFNDIDFSVAYDPTGVGLSAPWDQTGNEIANNTTYSNGLDPTDGSPAEGNPAIGVTNTPAYVLSSTSFAIPGSLPVTQTFNIDSYSSIIVYNEDDIIIYSGSYYTCLSGCPAGNQPDISPSYWVSNGLITGSYWTGGNRRFIRSASNPKNVWLNGTISSHTSSSVTFSIDAVNGTGTHSDWYVEFAAIGNLGGNTYKNNIFVTYTAGGASAIGYPSFRFDDITYPSTSNFNNNVFYSLQPPAGTFTNVIQTEFKGTVTTYDCAAAVAGSGSTFGSFSNCNYNDPRFVNASISFWDQPSNYNLGLLINSPAVNAGLPPIYPMTDMVGVSLAPTGPNDGGLQGSLGVLQMNAVSNKISVGGGVRK